jgi:hypothetical protein
MAFKMGSKRTLEKQDDWMRVAIRNKIHRDLSRFKSIKFYVKGSDDFTFRFRMQIRGKNITESQIWAAEFPITKEWSEVRIPFSSLQPARDLQGKIKNVSFDLRNVERIDWAANEIMVPKGAEGIVWLDEVSFY